MCSGAFEQYDKVMVMDIRHGYTCMARIKSAPAATPRSLMSAHTPIGTASHPTFNHQHIDTAQPAADRTAHSRMPAASRCNGFDRRMTTPQHRSQPSASAAAAIRLMCEARQLSTTQK